MNRSNLGRTGSLFPSGLATPSDSMWINRQLFFGEDGGQLFGSLTHKIPIFVNSLESEVVAEAAINRRASLNETLELVDSHASDRGFLDDEIFHFVVNLVSRIHETAKFLFGS